MEELSYQIEVLDILIYLTNTSVDTTVEVLRRSGWVDVLMGVIM